MTFWVAKSYDKSGNCVSNGPKVVNDKPSTMSDAQTWARSELSKPAVERVVLFQAMAEVTRTDPPVSVKPLVSDAPLARVCEDMTKAA